MSLRDRLLRFKFLSRMLLFLFCLPPPSCFLEVCLHTLLVAALKCFFPLKTSATSGTADSNKSAPTRFAARTICFLKQGMAVFPKFAQELQNHALFDAQYFCTREVQECLMQPFYTLILKLMNVRNFSKHENKSSYCHRDKRNLFTKRVSQISVYAVKKVFQQ